MYARSSLWLSCMQAEPRKYYRRPCPRPNRSLLSPYRANRYILYPQHEATLGPRSLESREPPRSLRGADATYDSRPCSRHSRGGLQFLVRPPVRRTPVVHSQLPHPTIIRPDPRRRVCRDPPTEVAAQKIRTT